MDTKKFLIFAALPAVLAGLAHWGNCALELHGYTIAGSRLPKGFDGYRIAHISDLHNARMGKDNEKLIGLLLKAKPHMIAITGDLIDSRSTNVEIALGFAREAVKIAPCYYVTGNHEARVNAYGELKAGLLAAGVTVLEDEAVEIHKEGETIVLMGVQDPRFQTGHGFGDAKAVIRAALAGLCKDGEAFTILLSHRPELFAAYAEQGIDLVLSGHAHGGQLRIPFLGGVVAPNQGLFPEFDAGLYTHGRTNMLVSRGIGNSVFPLRVNNRPEVLLVELKSGEQNIPI